MRIMQDSEKTTSATVRKKTLGKLHRIKKHDRRSIADVIDVLADRRLAEIAGEKANTSTI